jgi:hypothetical protein
LKRTSIILIKFKFKIKNLFNLLSKLKNKIKILNKIYYFGS